MSRFRMRVAAATLTAVSCLATAPREDLLTINDPECTGTRSGAACLSLLFVIADSTRQNDSARCNGFLHWGLYNGGDVGLLGPNDPSVQGGTVRNVNLSRVGASYALTIPDIEARTYQALAFLSQSASASSAVSGDPVTFPAGAFDVPANQHTQVTVILDWVR